MIKVNELRIGNLVYFLGNVHEIEGISKRLRPDVGHFLLSGLEHSQKGFHLKPIPLTEEWLVKFGFYETPNSEFVKYWTKNDVVLYNEYYHEKPFFVLSGRSIRHGLQYVHQLQNLYFALTGEELTWKQ